MINAIHISKKHSNHKHQMNHSLDKMQSYDTYKPSNIDWIGEIPSHWVMKRLKFIGESFIGIIYNPDELSDAENGILVLRSSNVQEAKLSFEDNVYVNISKKIQEKHITRAGDILICARNGSSHLVGKSAYINEDCAGLTFGAFMSVFRSNYGKFMFFFFNSNIFKAQTGLFSTSTINQLTSDTLNNLALALPPLTEQQAIVTYLDEKTTLIDELIAKKQSKIELLKEQRTALINHAVTKGLNAEVALKDSKIEWIGDIPEHWDVKKLKHVAKNIITGGTPSTENEEYFEGGDFDWFTPADFGDNLILKNSKRKITELAISEGKIKVFPPYAVLFIGIGATLGKVGINTEICSSNQQINAIIIDNKIISWFLAYFFKINIESLKMLANAATLPILNQSQTNEISIPFPPLSEQQAIVAYLDEQIALIDKNIELESQKITTLKEYRQSLISAVVTGKICVIDN